jgi:hypothetical protein
MVRVKIVITDFRKYNINKFIVPMVFKMEMGSELLNANSKTMTFSKDK